MPRTLFHRIFLAGMCLLSAHGAAVRADQQVTAAGAQAPIKLFVGCPIYRDTDAGRKSGCWLVTDPADGQRYDVTPGLIKPILGRQILVEGVVTGDDPGQCGGIVLEPASISVLSDACKEFLIPAEGHPGRPFVTPADVLQPSTVPRQLPPPPYDTKEYTILFELNSDFLVYQYAEMIIEKAALYARASKSKQVKITGYAATRGNDISGQHIREEISIAEARARMVAEAFTRLGIPSNALQLAWQGEPASGVVPTEGLVEAAKRRVTITIQP